MRWVLWLALGVAAIALAVWAFRPSPPTVDDYRAELEALAASSEGDAPATAIAARALLDGTAEDPIRADQMRRAAAWFDNAAQTDSTGDAAFFGALSWGLAGRDDLAQRGYRNVPSESRYARAARAALR